jgi:hypothetical protein
MGAPNSVAADIFQICLLAGRRRLPNGSDEPILRPENIQPITQYGVDSWPHSAGVGVSNLFLFTVPATRCLVVTYVQFYTGLAAGTDPAVNFGLPVSAPTRWLVEVNGLQTPVTQYLNAIAYTNCPCFYVFSPGTKPILSVNRSTLITQDSLLIQAQMQGYLVDSTHQAALMRNQTVPVQT